MKPCSKQCIMPLHQLLYDLLYGIYFFKVQGTYYLAYTDNIGKQPVVTVVIPTKRNKKKKEY